jgi:hypothetical protein
MERVGWRGTESGVLCVCLDHIFANADRGSNDSEGSILDSVHALGRKIRELGNDLASCGWLVVRTTSENKGQVVKERRQQHVQPLINGPATIVAPRPTRSSTI